MNRGSNQFRVQPVAAAVGMALSALFAAQAYAAPAANLPVNGTVVVGTASSTVAGATGDFGASAQASGTLTITNGTTGVSVITWGNNTASATLNTTASYAGFNIAGTVGGVAGSTVDFAGGGTVLNVDTSGNLSQLNGALTGTGTNVFVANANGIIVGSGATFNLGGSSLALIAGNIAGLGSMGTQSAISSFGIDFASGGTVNVNDGATFNTAGAVVIAGAGQVNVTDTAPLNSGLNLTLVGGKSGLISAAGAYTTATQATFTNGTTALTFALANAANTAVNLNLGHVTSSVAAAQAFTFGAGSAIYATGDVNNATSSNIDLTSVNPLTVQWGGTLTNNGLMAANQVGTSTTNAAIANNFVNAGTLTAKSGLLSLVAGNFTNTGTIALGTTATGLTIAAGNSVNLGGSVTGSLSTLGVFGGTANASQGVTISTALNPTNNVTLSGFNVTVNNSVQSANTLATNVVNVGVGASGANAVAGQFSLASGATLSANATNGTVNIYGNSSLAPANASIGGTVSANAVGLYLNTVNVGGNIATNNLNLSLTGDINKANGAGTAANNYLDNAALVTQLASTGVVNVALGAYGTHAQRFNIKVKGNASVVSYTSNFAPAGINNGGSTSVGNFTLPAANQLSQLRFQTTGNLFVNGNGSTISPVGVSGNGNFTWPGLTVLMAGGNLVSNVAIDNALGASVLGGNGVFLQGSTLQLNAPVYTSGNAWINFLQTGFGTATTTSPLAMTAYYTTTQPTNTSTGVSSYVPTTAPSSQLKLGRAYVTGYVPQ